MAGEDLNLDHRIAEWTRAAINVLRDGEWHSWEHTLLKASRTVPPGMAVRHAEQRRAYGSGTEVRVRERDRDFLIRTGSRDIARQILNNTRIFEVDGPPGPDRKIRLTRAFMARHPELKKKGS